MIEWTDNSDDEVSFAPGIVLLNEPGGKPITRLGLPEVRRNGTSINSIGYFFTPDPLTNACGYAQVFVHAVGYDGFTPSNTIEVPACFDRGTISFPDTGVGTSRDGHASTLAPWLLIAGALIGIAGMALRARGRRAA
jgi:hypothetical protein